ncbi:MAG: sodium/solute symporter [bacterium]
MEETGLGFIRSGDLITLTLYLLVTLGLGLWMGVRTKSTEGYFLGNRKMPSWAVGISMLGTSISSVTFLAYPGSAYDGNYSRIVPGVAYPIGAFIAIFLFVPFYRQTGYVSAYTYFERRFGLWARVYVCVLFSIAQLYRMGLILYLLSMAITSMHPELNLQAVILTIGVFVTVYTVLGGIEAVIWTDVFQTLVLILGGLAVIAVVFLHVDGGAGTVLSMGMVDNKFSLVGHEATSAFDFSLSRDTLVMLILCGVIGSTLEFALDQKNVQRYCAASTTRGAQKAVLVDALGCVPMWFLFMFIGTCLWVFYQINPGHMHREVLADEVFPYFILHELPNGLGGLVIAGVLAAAMSSIDSSMSGTTTTVTEDIYKRIFFKGRSDSHYLKAAKAIATASGVCMILVGLGLSQMRQEAILDVAFVIGAMVAGGVGGLFILGFFTIRGNNLGALMGVILSTMATFGMTYIEAKAMTWESNAAWMVQGAMEDGTVDLDTLKAEIRAETEARGEKPKLADLEKAQKERVHKMLTPSIESELGPQPPHLGDAIGFHPFLMGVITNFLALLFGYFFSFLFRPKPLVEIGGLTWWTRHMERL